MKYYNKAVECMPRSQLKVLQGERLKERVKYVYERVPFYKNKMDAIKLKPSDIKCIEDISKLPFTEKTDLRDNYPFGLFAVEQREVVRVHASSGTTGKMTVVGYTQGDIDIWSEVMARSLTCAHVTADSTVHVAYGYGMFTGGLGAHYGAEKIGARVVPASSGNTARQLMLLKDFEASTICCTPSYAAYLAEFMQNAGYSVDDFKLKSGVFGAEPWTNEMRRTIEKDLKISAFDIYGLSEIMGPGVSMECDKKNGLHVWEDHFFAETLDENLVQTADGAAGELVFTTLTKEALPLLRYRTNDLCFLNTDVCECGRTHARMSKIKGRKDDMIIVRGINIFPSQIEAVLMQMGYVSPHYQICVSRKNNSDYMEVRVELLQSKFSDIVSRIEVMVEEMEQRLHSILGINVKVKLVEPNSIPRSEGKAVRLIDTRNVY